MHPTETYFKEISIEIKFEIKINLYVYGTYNNEKKN